MAALVIASYTYPIWGLVLVFLVATRFAPVGSVAQRLLRSSLVSLGCTCLFASVAWGSQGFAFIAPWSMLLVDPENVTFHWPFAAGVAVASFLIAFLNGKRSIVSR
jgi:hypothetical protein